MLFLILLVIVIIIAAVAYAKSADGSYTMGKNMFKSSDDCLDEKENDLCEHDYWNKDKFK